MSLSHGFYIQYKVVHVKGLASSITFYSIVKIQYNHRAKHRRQAQVQLELLDFVSPAERVCVLAAIKEAAEIGEDFGGRAIDRDDESLHMSVQEWHAHCEVVLRANSAMNLLMLLELVGSRLLWKQKVKSLHEMERESKTESFDDSNDGGNDGNIDGSRRGNSTTADPTSTTTIRTSRLEGRDWGPGDAALVEALWCDRAVTRCVFVRVCSFTVTTTSTNQPTTPNRIVVAGEHMDAAQAHAWWRAEMASQREHGMAYWPFFITNAAKDAGIPGFANNNANSAINAADCTDTRTNMSTSAETFVGVCGLRARPTGGRSKEKGEKCIKCLEFGVHVRPEHRRKGYGAEMAGAVIGRAFERLHCHTVYAGRHPENRASSALMQNLGFEAVVLPPDGPLHPSYVLSRPAWVAQARRAAQSTQSTQEPKTGQTVQSWIDVFCRNEGEGHHTHPARTYAPSAKDLALYGRMCAARMPVEARGSGGSATRTAAVYTDTNTPALTAWEFSCERTAECIGGLLQVPGLCRHLTCALSASVGEGEATVEEQTVTGAIAEMQAAYMALIDR